MLVHASLFSGIGGFDLAADWMGWDNLFHCEWNPFGQRVLKHHFPNSISYNDITKTDFSIHKGAVDILTGGFPCQPYSTAGKRLGKADERHLFPHMLRCVKEVKPRWVVGENVRGLINWNGGLVFNEVYDDLEREGYEVQSFLIPAASVGAPHQRYRVWFIAYNAANTSSVRLEQHSKSREIFDTERKNIERKKYKSTFPIETMGKNVTNTSCKRQYKQRRTKQFINKKTHGNGKASWSDNDGRWPTVSPVCIRNDGLPNRLDGITFSKWRKESIKAGGNAIVPQVALQIFKAIEEFELMVNK